jgi:hypothetical protein
MATDSFSNSYAEAQRKFIDAARDSGARLQSHRRDDVNGKEGETLVCDVAVLGDDGADRAAIAIVGTHGIEGYAGSAILHRWLMSRPGNADIDGIKIVLVHAINPWAFSHKTRTTENNVDLNRNFLVDPAQYGRQNPSYDRLAPFLHAADFDASGNLAAHRAYKSYLDQHGWHIENEMWEGQGHRPDGLCYTGKEPEWANRTFRKIVNEHLASAKTIGFIDWHTGLGRFGEVVYLIFDDKGSAEHEAAAGWWGRSDADRGAFNAGAVPRYEGLLCRAIRQELSAPRIAGAVVELGTGDEFTIFRADRLDRWLWFEGHDDPQHEQFREDYKNALCPNDVAWRRWALSEGPAIMTRLVEGVRTWRD